MHYIKLPESSVGHKDGLAGGLSGGVSFYTVSYETYIFKLAVYLLT